MTKLKKTTHLLSMLLLIVAASSVNAETKYTDNGCIKDINELKQRSWIDSSTCKSLDLGVKSLKTQGTVKTKRIDPIFQSNDLINAEQANIANNFENEKNLLGKRVESAKMNFLENSYIDKFILFVVLVLLYKKMVNAKENNDDFSFLRFSSYSLICLSIFAIALKTDYIEKATANISIKISNIANNFNHKLQVSEITNIDLIVSNDTENEALRDIDALSKITICLGRNKKNAMNDIATVPNLFNTDKDITDYYDNISNVYINNVDEKINQDFQYNLNEYGFLKNVKAGECGNASFKIRNINKDIFDKMFLIKFKELLHDAITNNDSFSSNLEKMKSSYFKLGVNYTKTDDEFLKIAGLFTDEYKKGLIFGSVLTNYDKTNLKVLKTDYSNLKNTMQPLNVISNALTASKCMLNPSILKTAIDEFYERDNISKHIHRFDCINFDADWLNIAFPVAKIYKDNKESIDFNISLMQDAADEKSEIAPENLILKYKSAHDSYTNLINNMVNFKEDLAYYHNKGGFDSQFNVYLQSKQNNYKEYLFQIMDSSVIDYSKSLPFFGSQTENAEFDLDLYTVNAYTRKILNRIDYNKSGANEDFANKVMSYTYDNTNANVDNPIEAANSKPSFISDFSDNYLNVMNKSKVFLCNVEIENCNEKFNGVKAMFELSDAYLKDGFNAFKIGLGMNITSKFINSLANRSSKIDSGDDKIKLGIDSSKSKKSKVEEKIMIGKEKRKSEKKSLSKNISAAANAGESVGYAVMMAGFIMMLVGSLLSVVFEFQTFYMNYALLLISYVSYTSGLTIMFMLLVGFATNTTTQGVSETLSKVIEKFVEPFFLILNMLFIVMTVSIVYTSILDNIRRFTGYFKIGYSTENIYYNSIAQLLFFIALPILLIYLMMKLIGFIRDQYSNNSIIRAVGSQLKEGDNLVNRLNFAAMSTFYFVSRQMNNKKYSKYFDGNKKKEEDNKDHNKDQKET